MFSSLAPARRRLVLIVVAVLLVLLVAGTVLAATRSRNSDRTASPVAQDRPGPVLLVPGYGGSVTSLNSLAARLRAAGRDSTVVSLPDRAEGDLSAQAEVLAAAARTTLARTGAASVDVVGYSAGGVVARLWIKEHGGAAVVRRVVTLGSPQHGTALAALGSLVAGQCPLACQQLVPTSPLLTALNAAPELPAGPVFVSIWSAKDQVVLPPDSAVLTGAVNVQVQRICADSTVDHTQLPTDPLVGGIVLAELGTAPASVPGTGDCTRLRAG